MADRKSLTLKSSLEVMDSANTGEKAMHIRDKRFHNIDQFKAHLQINEQLCVLKNISDTGMAFSSKADFENNIDAKVKFVISDKLKIELAGKIVWKRNTTDGLLYGLHFNNTYLPEGFVEALEQVNLLNIEVTNKYSKYEELNSEFKMLTSNIKYYLESVKHLLDKIEHEILVTSQNTRNSYKEVIVSNFSDDFVAKLKSFSKELDRIFTTFNDEESKNNHIIFFREQVGHYYTGNPFIGRALRKPRGYAGDYEMMNQIYRDSHEGRTYFEMLMHRYGIQESSSQSVKYRINYFVDKILKNSANKKNFNICSVACGPAKEIVNFLSHVNIDASEAYNIYLLDQDIEALLNAKRNISEQIIKRNLKANIHIKPISVKMILEQSNEANEIFQIGFDFIYTAGLYDYLTQPVAKMLTGSLLSWLKPGGEFVIGNFHPSNPTKTISELVADWKLIHRNEEDMLDLVYKEKVKSANLHKDDLGIDIFLEITK